MSVPIRTRTIGPDPVARAHRRAGRFRAVGTILLCAVAMAGVYWLMFGSSVFGITEVRIEGVSASVAAELRGAIDEMFGARTFGFLRPTRNILLLDEDGMATALAGAFANLEYVKVRTEYPHTVVVTATERVPVGIWCVADICRYFDASGVQWGTAVPSRGPLLLLVNDERQEGYRDMRVFDGLMDIIGRLPAVGLRPISVVFPDAAPGDVRISLHEGYDIILDALGDVEDQIATLGVLLGNRAVNPAFRPQYIDLRTPGRAYYK